MSWKEATTITQMAVIGDTKAEGVLGVTEKGGEIKFWMAEGKGCSSKMRKKGKRF
jgi:hypothetical protein